MHTLIEQLKNPELIFADNFSTPEKANALLLGLCQDAAIELEKLDAKMMQMQGREIKLEMSLNTPTTKPEYEPVQVPQLGDGILWCDTCRSVQETVDHVTPNDRDVWCKGESKWLQGPFYTLHETPSSTPPLNDRGTV